MEDDIDALLEAPYQVKKEILQSFSRYIVHQARGPAWARHQRPTDKR